MQWILNDFLWMNKVVVAAAVAVDDATYLYILAIADIRLEYWGIKPSMDFTAAK